MGETVTKNPPVKAAAKKAPAKKAAASEDKPEAVNVAIVRRYLKWLENPDSIKDQNAIKAKTDELTATDDPIKKLTLLKELAELNVSDPTPLRDAFITVAKDYADDNSIPASAFVELGVGEDVLRAAGFHLPRTNGSGGGRRSSGEGRQRAVAVPVEEIQAAMRARFNVGDTFLLADVAELGGSPATQRKAVDEMVHGGLVEKLGPLPNYSGRGRAPVQYKRVA